MEPRAPSWPADPSKFRPELRWVPAEVPNGTPVNVAQMMRRLAEGIRDGAHPEPTFADAVRKHRLLEAIERSSESGKTVPVQQ